MPTEITKTLDEVWNEDIEEELDKIEEEEVDGNVKEEEPEIPDDQPEVVVEEEVQEDVAKEEEEPENKVDWKALGLDIFEGKTQAEVAEQIKFERKQLGHTTNMLGELRREITQLKVKPVQVEKPVEKPKDILSEIRDLDEADVAKFNTMYEKNPVKAFMTYGGESIKAMIAEEVKRSVPDVEGVLQKTKSDMEYSTFISSNPDLTDADVDQMKIFDDEQYLGEQKRSYADLYGLAKLWRNRDERAEKIYMLMKKHSTVSFSEACDLLSVPKTEKVVVNKDKIVQSVKKNEKTNIKSHSSKVADSVPTAKTVDEAFESFND